MKDFAIRPARTDERDTIATRLASAHAKFISDMRRDGRPIHADHESLIADGVIYVITDAMDGFGLVVQANAATRESWMAFEAGLADVAPLPAAGGLERITNIMTEIEAAIHAAFGDSAMWFSTSLVGMDPA